MTDVSSIIGSGLAHLNASRGGATFEYRAGRTGAWTSFTVADFHETIASLAVDDYEDSIERRSRTATLKTSKTAPVLSIGWQVRVSASDSDIFTVTEGPFGSMQRVYQLQDIATQTYRSDRGRLR